MNTKCNSLGKMYRDNDYKQIIYSKERVNMKNKNYVKRESSIIRHSKLCFLIKR